MAWEGPLIKKGLLGVHRGFTRADRCVCIYSIHTHICMYIYIYICRYVCMGYSSGIRGPFKEPHLKPLEWRRPSLPYSSLSPELLGFDPELLFRGPKDQRNMAAMVKTPSKG